MVGKIRKCALPIYHQGTTNRAVLGIHGFMGYPGELAYPAKALAAEGYTVSVPRLPGHGTCGEDFKKTNHKQWLRAAIDAYLDLKTEHDEIYVMGHSMGGVLALILSSMFPIKKVALMAPALKLKPPIKLTIIAGLLPITLKNKPAWESNPNIQFFDDRDDDDDAFLGQEYWSWSYLPQVRSLACLMNSACSLLPQVKGKVICMMGAHDNTVRSEVGEILKQALPHPATVHVMPESGHLVPYDSDHKENASLIIDWFKK